MKKDLNLVFEELLSRYIKAIEKNYLWRYKRAKDKEFIKDELQKGVDFIIEMNTLDDAKGKLINTFWEWYKRGENFNDIMKQLRQSYGEVDNIKPYGIIENGKTITQYLSEEEKALKKLALDERKLMKLLIDYAAHKEIQKRLPTMFGEQEASPAEKEKTASYPIKWTGKKDNKNEFVQLVYGLHKAGLINEGKGEITKITEALAGIFKMELGKGWQANHSTSIHKARANYQPLIFHKIREAYGQYFCFKTLYGMRGL
jgi:hypothetical protein